MKRYLLLLAMIIASATACNGQLIWKISGNGIHDSYLLGSMHIVSYKFCGSLSHFDKVFTTADVVYGECVMFQDSIGSTSSITQELFLPKGKSLNDYYSKEDFEKIQDYCQESFATRPKMINYSPIGLIEAATRSIASRSSQLYAQGNESLDFALQLIASSMGKEVKGLETFEYTNKLSSEIIKNMLPGESIEEQAKSLLKYVQTPSNHPDSIFRAYTELFDAYVHQDLPSLERAFHDINGTDYGNKFLSGRNSNWVSSIIEVIKQRHALFVVGAAHLLGPQGLIELLKQEGFELTPVV